MSFIFPTLMAAEGSLPAQQPSLFESLVPLLFVFIIMYFLLIRPQAKKVREHSELIQKLKSGDEIVTTGGIIGKVRTVSDDFVSIDTGSTTLKVVKENISRLTKVSQNHAATKAKS